MKERPHSACGTVSPSSDNGNNSPSPIQPEKTHSIQRGRKRKGKPHSRSSGFPFPPVPLKVPICTDNAITPLPYLLRSPIDSAVEHFQSEKSESPARTAAMSALIRRAVAVTMLFSLASFLNVARIRPETRQGMEQNSGTCSGITCTVTDFGRIGYIAIAGTAGTAVLSHLALSSLSWDLKYIVAKAKTFIFVISVLSLVVLLPCGSNFLGFRKRSDSFEPGSCQNSYLVVGAVHVTAYFFLDFLQRILQLYEKEKLANQSEILKEAEGAKLRTEDSLAKKIEMKALFARTITREIRYTVNMAADTMRSLIPSLSPITERLPCYTAPLPQASALAFQTALQNIEHLSYHLDAIGRMWFTGSNVSSGTAISSKGGRTVATAFDVGELLQSVGDALAGTAALADIELVVHHHPDVTPANLIIRGDEGGFRHVLVNLLSTICASASPGSSIEVGVNVLEDSTSTTIVGDSRCHLEVIHTSPTRKNAQTTNGTNGTSEGEDVKQVPDANTTANLVNSIGGTLSAREIDGRFVFEVIVPVNAATDQETNEIVHGDPVETPTLCTLRGTPGPFVDVPNEPSTAELRSFILEMRCKKVVLHAKVQSISAKHFTSTLTSWGADIYHLPICPSTKPPIRQSPESQPLAFHIENQVKSSSVEPQLDHDDSSNQRGSDASFIVIDDDIPTLKEKLRLLIDLSHRALISTSFPPSDTTETRTRSNESVQPPSMIPAVIHFTSVSYYQLAREAVQDALTKRTQPSTSSPYSNNQHIAHPFEALHTPLSSSTPHYALPPHLPYSEHLTSFVASRIFLVLKPSGPRRFLTTLFSASRLPTSPSIDLSQILTSSAAFAASVSGNRRTLGSETNLAEKFSGDSTSAASDMDASRIPKITTPGGTAILFEPVPGASRSSVRNGVKSMRARLVTPVQINGKSDPSIPAKYKMDWSMLTQYDRAITAPIPGKVSVEATTPQSYFPTVVPGSSTIPSRAVPPDHLAGDGKYRSYRTSKLFGSTGTGMSSSSSSSSVSADTPATVSVKQTATAGGMLSTSPLSFERPLANAQPENLPRMIPIASPTTSDDASVSVGSGRRVLAGEVAHTSALIPPRIVEGNSVSAVSGKQAVMSNTGSPVSDRRKARGTGALSALFGERNLTPPINVLIVEDNPINQTILSTFLRKRKIEYSVASNGQEAVDKWSMGGFHLVLMDIQLPVMDGIQATKEIRRMERIRKIGLVTPQASKVTADKSMAFSDDQPKGGSNRNRNETFSIPPSGDEPTTSLRSPVIIVALTASSLQSDRHAALAAGCNDFLTKPVSLVWLEKKIMEWGCMQALIDFEGWKKWKSGAGSLDKEVASRSKIGDTTTTTIAAFRSIPKKTLSVISTKHSSTSTSDILMESPASSTDSSSSPAPRTPSVLSEAAFSPSKLHMPSTIHPHSVETQSPPVVKPAITQRRRTTGTLVRTASDERSLERERRKMKFLGPDSRSPSFSTDKIILPPSNGTDTPKLEYPGDAFRNNPRYRQDRGEVSLRR